MACFIRRGLSMCPDASVSESMYLCVCVCVCVCIFWVGVHGEVFDKRGTINIIYFRIFVQ